MGRFHHFSFFFFGILFLVLFQGNSSLFAQGSLTARDSLRLESHSPRRASLYSAFIPGLGQIYNQKYWKVPVVYAGFGVLVYFVIFNTTHYQDYMQGLIDFTDTVPGTASYLNLISKKLDPAIFDPILHPDTYNPAYATWFEEQLKNGIDYYRRNRDLSYIGMGIWYILNIIDATVDAHLFDYDVGDDLTLHIDPGYIPGPRRSPETIGIRLTFQF